MDIILNSFWEGNGYKGKWKEIENNILFMVKVRVLYEFTRVQILSTSCYEYLRVLQIVYSSTGVHQPPTQVEMQEINEDGTPNLSNDLLVPKSFFCKPTDMRTIY